MVLVEAFDPIELGRWKGGRTKRYGIEINLFLAHPEASHNSWRPQIGQYVCPSGKPTDLDLSSTGIGLSRLRERSWVSVETIRGF